MVAVLLLIFALAFLMQGLRDYRERQIAEEAVRRAGEGAEVVWVVDAFRTGGGRRGRETIWCGKVDRVNGLVAVRTEAYNLPFMEHVREVETAWLAPRFLDEDALLNKCGRYRR